MRTPVPNAGTSSRKGIRGEQCNGFPDQLRPTEPGRPGLSRPDLRSSSSVASAGNSMVWFRVSALNLRGGGGLTPNDWSGAAAGLAGQQEAPRIVGGDDRIAAQAVVPNACVIRPLVVRSGHQREMTAVGVCSSVRSVALGSE